MVVAQVTPACAFWWFLCSSSARLTSTRRRSFATDVHVRFSAIPGRSIRAGPIWPRNLVHPDEFGEKSTIFRFRFGGWARHCTCARGFLPIIGRSADTDVTEIALHLDFLEKAWISRFHFDPVHRDRPNLDFNFGCILIIFVKIQDFPVSVRWICASLARLCVNFIDVRSITQGRSPRSDQASGYRENTMNFKVSF